MVKMENGLEVNVLQKPAKVSVCEAEEQKTREVVDEKKSGAKISLQSRGQERELEVVSSLQTFCF